MLIESFAVVVATCSFVTSYIMTYGLYKGINYLLINM